MYCKGCRERMMANGTWTEAHAKRQSELNAIVMRKGVHVGLVCRWRRKRLVAFAIGS
jgi:hypothetical protein